MKRKFTKHQCLSLEEIKSYLEKEVDEQENVRMSYHFSSCSLCAEVKENFSIATEQGFPEEVKEIKTSIFNKVDTRKPVSRRLFLSRVAAGVSFLITGAASLFYWNTTANSRLYEKHFQPYDIAEVITRGEKNGLNEYNEESLSEDLKLALESYHAGKYKESLPYFKTVLDLQPQNSYATFLNALANLAENNIEYAIDKLEIVRINDDSLYEDATWYLALANLRKGDKKEVLYYLKALEKIEGSFYEAKANELKKTLK